jgi:hypothetical protein
MRYKVVFIVTITGVTIDQDISLLINQKALHFTLYHAVHFTLES